jgi:NAD(P)-dependent dehydrogenase (short-subunit alcohol dehydrogenase family)
MADRKLSQIQNPYETLKGKICVITGGTKGLGEATAKLFASHGGKVLITGRDEEKGKSIQASVPGIVYRRVDLEDRDDTLEFVSWLDSHYPEIDVMISNASRDSRYSVTEIPMEEWDRLVNLNLTAPFLLAKTAAKKMIANKTKGKIILVSAIQSISPMEKSFAYVTTKGGLVSMVRTLAVDLGPHGILVTGVLPGPFYVGRKEIPLKPKGGAASLLGRMGTPDEMAHVMGFLASDANTFMTGNLVVVDGGRVISRKPDPEEMKMFRLPKPGIN